MTGVNHYERAFRAWPVLAEVAGNRATVTYGQLAHQLGIHHRTVRFVLAVIQDYCLQDQLPPLTILVVTQDRGMPGEGFIAWDFDDLPEGYRRVYAYPWQELPNAFAFAGDGATPDELAEQLVVTPEESASVYGQLSRGIAQVVFRSALMRAYGQRCAFCGLSLTDALVAAHIIPWGEASEEQRLAPSNGLLLCSTHHALFDAGILTVTHDWRIACRLDTSSGHQWTDADQRTALALHGQQISLPADPRLRPSVVALERLASGQAN
jgi:putative restriction endonuclease